VATAVPPFRRSALLDNTQISRLEMMTNSIHEARLTDHWSDIFRSDRAVHLAIMGSITAATFQGWLKDRIEGPLPYALSELFFIAAVVIWFGSLAVRHGSIRGPGPVPLVVLAAILVPLLYMAHPGSPLLIELAGLRSWAEFPVACLIALTVIKSPGQVRAYVGLILILCVITALYGIRQYQIGPAVALGSGALAQLRHGPTVFYRIAGITDFRAFSTFTFPAPFAGMMVFGILFATGIALSGRGTKRARVLVALLIPLFFMGITVSGTRAAVIVLMLGLMAVALYRGLGIRMLVLAPVAVAALHLGSLFTAGRAVARWQSAFLQEGLLWTYAYAPITIAGRTLAEFPWGMGLGRSGVGVPFAIYQSYPQGYFRGSDGDIGRAAVEMGIFGLVLLLVLLIVLLPYAARATKALMHTRSGDVALGAGALILSNGILVLIGSPFSSVPHAIVWWFFLGALLKLAMMEYESRRAAEGGDK
jgi:O-antigen ligase